MTAQRDDSPLGRLIGAALVVGVLGAATAIALRAALTHGLALLYGAPTSSPGWPACRRGRGSRPRRPVARRRDCSSRCSCAAPRPRSPT